MNPYKLSQIYKQLTSQNSILKKYLKLGTKDIKQPDLPAFVEQKNMFNRFMRDNPRPDQLDRKDMAGGGMLVKPSADGSRPGYKGDKTILQVLRENIEEKGGVKVYKIEKGVTKDGYAKNGLIDKIIKNTNTELSPKKISKLIDEVTTKKGWFTKQAYRKYAIVDSFMKDYGINDEFTGAGKFDSRLQEFKLKSKGDEFKQINETFNNWIKGDFEVQGYDRSKFDNHLKKNLKNWKPIIRTEKQIQSAVELRWLYNINQKHPNWSIDKTKNAFDKQFKKNKYWSDTNFTNRTLDLYGHLVHGKGKNNTVIKGVNKGERSKWVKGVMQEVKGGNYYRFLTAADNYEAKGNMNAAKKLRNAAEKLFLKDEGIFYGLGQAEHPWFSNYGGAKGMFQIDSLVKGDLNNFKASNFEIPIRDLIKKYEAKTATSLQKKRIMDEINLRRNFLNTITDIGDGGMARNVTFDFNSETGKVKVTNTTPDVYNLYKKNKLDPLELSTRGTNYRDTLIKTLQDVDFNIVKKGTDEIKTGKIGANTMNDLLAKIGCPNKVFKASGGRVGYQDGTDICPTKGAQMINSGMKNASPAQLKNFAAFANRARALGKGVMKFGIIPEAMYVAAESTIRLAMGDKPIEAFLQASEYLLPGDQTKLAKVIQAKRVMNPEVAAIIGRSLDYKNQLAKIDSLTSQRDNLENLSGGGEFDYIGDLNQDVRNLNNQIKQATDALNTKFKMTDAEKTYADAMQNEIEDRIKSGSFLTKVKSMFRDVDPDSDVETLAAPEKTQEQLNLKMADQLPRDLLLASEAEMIQAAKVAQAQGYDIPDDYYIKQQQNVKNMSLAELAAATSPEQVYGAQGYIAEPLFKGEVEKPQNVISDMEREITGQTNVANPFDIDLSMMGSGLRGFSAAGGGIAKEAGDPSGPPPESGPNPQGLSYLMKRGKNI